MLNVSIPIFHLKGLLPSSTKKFYIHCSTQTVLHKLRIKESKTTYGVGMPETMKLTLKNNTVQFYAAAVFCLFIFKYV